MNLSEMDWKYMSRLKPALLERLCNRILDEIQQASPPEKRKPSAHDQYLRIFKLLQDQDKIVANCFDDWRRNRLLERIVFMIRHSVITQEELAALSPETREIAQYLATGQR
jgi:hypothetical protein